MKPGEHAAMFAVEDSHWWYRALRRNLDAALRTHVPEGSHILDIGCGTGANMAHWRGRYDVSGIDYSFEGLTYCHEREERAVVRADAARLPFADDAFDAVVSCDVLCHKSLPDKQAVMNEWFRVVKPSGTLIVNLPAYQWIYSSHDVHVETDKRFSIAEARAFIAEAGAEVIDIGYWNTWLFPLIAATRLYRRALPPAHSDIAEGTDTAFNAPFNALLAMEHAVHRTIPAPFGLSILVVARKTT